MNVARRASTSRNQAEQPLRLGKLEAARRQLETAIRLYFEHGDEVSIHTLAAQRTRSYETSINTVPAS